MALVSSGIVLIGIASLKNNPMLPVGTIMPVERSMEISCLNHDIFSQATLVVVGEDL